MSISQPQVLHAASIYLYYSAPLRRCLVDSISDKSERALQTFQRTFFRHIPASAKNDDENAGDREGEAQSKHVVTWLRTSKAGSHLIATPRGLFFLVCLHAGSCRRRPAFPCSFYRQAPLSPSAPAPFPLSPQSLLSEPRHTRRPSGIHTHSHGSGSLSRRDFLLHWGRQA